jgi:corrinoid protein of di/trimethylamine methyltransferase
MGVIQSGKRLGKSIPEGKEEEMQELQTLASSLEKGDFEKLKSLTEKLLAKGIPPSRIINEGVMPGMEAVGRKYENGEYFLPDLFIAGEGAKQVTEILKPHMEKEREKRLGTVVIGTIFGDIHDVGKNLVASMLAGCGFRVVDLGTGVSAKAFVETAQKENADIIAVSALLTTTMLNIKEVIKTLDSIQVPRKIKILIGGASVDEDFARKIGVDGYGKNVTQALQKARELLLD